MMTVLQYLLSADIYAKYICENIKYETTYLLNIKFYIKIQTLKIKSKTQIENSKKNKQWMQQRNMHKSTLLSFAFFQQQYATYLSIALALVIL